MTGRRRGGLMTRALGHLLAGVLLAAAAWAAGLFWFIADIPRAAPSESAQRTDAIVVLTGGSKRLTTGLELLAAGRAGKLFVSGVYDGVEVQELLKLSRHLPAEMECCITLGYSADSTLGNAYETAEWMREQGFASLRLVTANYHMRRALLELASAMPGVEMVPHPVVAPTVHLADWWLWPGTANLLVNEYNKLLIASLRAFVRRQVDG